ncbi:hypothetical protein Tco_0037358 [Tanacetum coccineum]
MHSEVLMPSNYDGRHIREIFKEYTRLEARLFKDLITEYMESIEKCIVERALHEQEIQKRLKRLNDRKLQIQECKVQEKDQSLGNQSSTSGNESNISGIKSSRSRNECSERYNLWNDTDICPSYDTKPMAEAPNFANYIVFAVEKQHTV